MQEVIVSCHLVEWQINAFENYSAGGSVSEKLFVWPTLVIQTRTYI